MKTIMLNLNIIKIFCIYKFVYLTINKNMYIYIYVERVCPNVRKNHGFWDICVITFFFHMVSGIYA